jgi:hypothetical protein
MNQAEFVSGIINIFLFLDYFNVLMLKIIFKK